MPLVRLRQRGPGTIEPALNAAASELGLLGRQCFGSWIVRTDGRLPTDELDFDAPHLVRPEFEVAGAIPVVFGGAGTAPDDGDDAIRRPPAWRSEKTPAFGVPTLVTSPTANTPGYEVSSVSGLTGIHPSAVIPDSATTAGTWCVGTPRNRSKGNSVPSANRATLAVGSSSRISWLGYQLILRSEKAWSTASDAAGEGGIGTGNA